MKKKTQTHTPGPWLVTREAKRLEIAGAAHDVGLSNGGEGIAKVWAARDAGDGLANARLISAAPELLEALRQAEWALEKYETSEDDPDDHPSLDIVRAAIAKAEGK